MKRLGILFLAGVVLISAGCMKKRRLSGLGIQSNFNDPSQRDPQGGICEGGVNLFIRPDSASSSNSFLVGQNVQFLLNASGCKFGYGVRKGGSYERFDFATAVNVVMPQSAQSGRQEEFSVVALDAQGNIHRGPYTFRSTPFNVTEPELSLNFFPANSISVEGNSVRFVISANQSVQIQRIYSDEENYIAQTIPPFSLSAGQMLERTIQLSRGQGGGPGVIKLDYVFNGNTDTAELNIIHNVCEGSFDDDFLGNGASQTLRYRCADGFIRVRLNLSEDLVSRWQVPTGYQFKDLMHGKLDGDDKADILFFTKKTDEPQKAYFFYGKSKPSTNANSNGGSFNVVACSGAWEAPSQTSIPNQFSFEEDQEEKPAKVFSVQANGVRYEADLEVTDTTCRLGAVRQTNPEIRTRVSKDQVNSGESFSVFWSASHVSGYQCELQKTPTGTEAWDTVANTTVTPTGASVAEEPVSQTITASTDYRAICSKSTNGGTTVFGTLPENKKTVTVRTSTAPSTPSTNESTIRMLANSKAWIQTGINVPKEKSLSISATGTIKLGPRNNNIGPGGVSSNRKNCKFKSSQGLPGGALLARIGVDGRPFVVGSSHSSASRSKGGHLYLGINDPKCATDNSGSFDVTVQVQQ